VYTRFLLN